MSQSEIYEFLKRNSPNCFTPIEIRINLGIKEASCFNNLKRMLKRKEIQRIDHKYFIESNNELSVWRY